MTQLFNYIRTHRTFLCCFIFIFGTMFNSCEKFVELDPPSNQLTGTSVFSDATTVNAALAGIYARIRDNGIASGGTAGLPYLMGHYTDELVNYNVSQSNVQAFFENNLLATNSGVATIWNNTYNLIYACNAVLEGVQNSDNLSIEESERFLGEAYFLRAFLHQYLVSVFGDIPYVVSTDYNINSQVARMDTNEVHQQIISDLAIAKTLLPSEPSNIRSHPNMWAASALLARVYLYTEQWDLARQEAEELMGNADYLLNEDISMVFLKNSTETLWQLPQGTAGANTLEAMAFIFTSGPPPSTALSPALINSFEDGDARLAEWVGEVSNGATTWYHPYKYKLNTNTGVTQECSIVLRLAEMYLVAAEANTQLGNLAQARDLLNPLRERADLPIITTMDPQVLLEAIYHERRIEFFTEQAHRWLDLKRTGLANDALSVKPNWDSTDLLLPIPEQELLLNPNLMPQNNGY